MFEPCQRDIGIVLHDLCWNPAVRLVLLEHGSNAVAFEVCDCRFEESDRTIHSELGAGTYGEVRGCFRVAEDDHFAYVPVVAEDSRELPPV